jgi:hypothetical protein
VGGDPAELMAMCVENGMFTVSFLKEGISKVSPGQLKVIELTSAVPGMA